jgi:signal transduction histidine kinase
VRRARPEAADEVAEINRVAQESLREVRDVVRGYRIVDVGGELAGARSVLRAAGVTCTVSGDEFGAALPETTRSALGWVLREAVTNVLRHSRASECAIDLGVRDGTVTLRVENDGVTSPTTPNWGNGLRGLAERLAAVSGTVTAAAGPGRADRFAVVAELPAMPGDTRLPGSVTS